MFCNQCEQTAKGIGCNIAGVCGKNEEVADLQDLLIHALQGLALFAQEGRKVGIIDDATDLFTLEAIFSTLAVYHQVSPPTINIFEAGEGCDLDYCAGQARQMKIDVAISNSFGFGGTNGTVVIRRV